MAQVWNEGAPALANTISADVPDIEEMLQFLSHWLREKRSVFTYNGGTTAYTVKCKAAFYYCKDKVCWWDAELTTGAIAAPASSDWFYLYLDNSIITSGTEITATELIWSATEPAWSDAYGGGWYNGDDRCIFAVLCNSTPTNILEFFHEGDLVLFADYITVKSGQDVDAAWEDLDGTIKVPIFTRRALIKFTMSANADADPAVGSWKTNGQTGTTGHHIGSVDADNATYSSSSTDVIVDSNYLIELKMSANGDHSISVFQDGWYFSVGL